MATSGWDSWWTSPAPSRGPRRCHAGALMITAFLCSANVMSSCEQEPCQRHEPLLYICIGQRWFILARPPAPPGDPVLTPSSRSPLAVVLRRLVADEAHTPKCFQRRGE